MTRLAGRPASPTTPETPSPSTGKVYDRSSLEGDFLVMIPNQTPEDFERYAPETRFCEFFDGTVYMPSPVSDRHQEIVIFLTTLLDLYLEARDLEIKLLTGPAVLRLAEDRMPEPDVQVRTNNPADAQPLLVIEIVSPSHRAYDLDFKSGFYRANRLPEIWYIDPASRTLFRDLLGDAGYTRQAIVEGKAVALRIPGFWVDVAWLWAEPPPRRGACLAAILADPNGGMP